MQGALSGIRIVELSQVLAAPFCGYQFALLGAHVIKVEHPDTPDCGRGRGPVAELNQKGVGLTYQVQGGNKQSLALDIAKPEGREALLKLCKTADVFLENYSTGVLQGLGLGYEQVKARNPKIVYCSMTGYGDTGPLAGKGAYDNTIQAASGIVSQCGGVKPRVSFVDYAAGYSAAFAVAAALLQRERTGEGCHISASMLEVGISLMGPEVAAKQAAPQAPPRKEAGIATFETADGQLMLGAFKPSQYRKLGTCLSQQGFEVRPLERVRNWPDIWENADAIGTALQEVFIQRTADAWQALLEAADIPAERVVPLEEAVRSPQLAQRGYFTTSPDDPSVTLPLTGFTMSRGGPSLTSAPPRLGQHSRQLLAGAGLNDAEIEALFDMGVVA